MNELSKPLFEQIRELVARSRERAIRSVNRELVDLYWNIGRLIVEDEQGGAVRAAYGERVIKELATRLTIEFGPGFTPANLRNMRQFFLAFKLQASSNDNRDLKRYALRSELSWTHYRILMRVKDESARFWYMNEAADAGWSIRNLERQVGAHYFERLLSSRDRVSVEKKANEAQQSSEFETAFSIKDPYVFEFLGLTGQDAILERDLEAALIGNLQKFLLELGRGFSFVARQYRISTETTDFYVDLVFYNFKLKCFVLADLKTGNLTHQDIGQMDMYVRLFDDRVRQKDDKPTIGIVLCSHKDVTVVHYSVLSENEQLFASEYWLYLPTEAELRAELERDRAALEELASHDDNRGST